MPAEDELTPAPDIAGPEGPPAAPHKRLADRNRKAYEVVLVIAMGVGTALLLLGGALTSIAGEAEFRSGAALMAIGLAATTLSMALSRPLWRIRVLLRRSTGGTHYDQLKHWTRFKASVILLNLLAIVAVVVLGASLLHRFGPIEVTAPFHIELRLATLYTLMLGLCLAATHWLSLRTPVERPAAPVFLTVVFILSEGLTFTLAVLGAVLAWRPVQFGNTLLTDTDAPFFLLASMTAASLSLFLGRSLPNLVALVTKERAYYAGHSYLSRSKSVVMPAMMAFALLFAVVLVLLVFGVGYTGLLTEIPRNSLLIGVFGFIVAALAASVIAAVFLSRSEDRATLYRLRRSPETKLSLLILGSSAATSSALFGASAWLAVGHSIGWLGPARWLDLLAFALMAALGPYGFYAANRFRRIKKLEERFPDFLRDVAASRRAGLTLSASIAIAARGEYGALTPEIVKMADQLSWDVPFEEALQRFGDRVRTPLVQRAVSLIIEAGRSGGNVTEVLIAAARDAREIKNLEIERRVTMSLYTVVIYVTFMVFLGVAAVLYGTFIPNILHSASAAGAKGLHGFGGVSFSSLKLEDYRVFYFLAAIMQGVGNGFVAGMFGTGKWLDGLRHAFIMVLVTWLVFAVLIGGG